MNVKDLFDSGNPAIYEVRTHAPGPAGALPITPEMLLQEPSGNLFGWSQNAGMGWAPEALGGKQVLILSTHGGVRAENGTPIALGYHTGTESQQSDPVCGCLYGSLRRPLAGYNRHVRFASLQERCGHRLSQADPLSADEKRRGGRRDLR
jgi:hypothetical protein